MFLKVRTCNDAHTTDLGSGLLDNSLLGASNDNTSGGGLGVEVGNGLRTTMELHEGVEVSLGGANNLDLADKDVLEGVDGLALTLNGAANDIGGELKDELGDVRLLDVAGDDGHHLLANLANLTSLSIRGGAALGVEALGEANGEDAENVAISGLDISVSLDEGLVLTNEATELVGGHVHALEGGQALSADDLIDLEGELAEILALGLEITEGDGDLTVKEGVAGGLLTSGLGGHSLADLTDSEVLGGLDVEPLLADERINAVKREETSEEEAIGV